MSNFHQIDPSKMILSLGKLPTPISGYAKGTFIKISRDADAFGKSVGSDGEVSRVRNKNRSGSVEITLQKGSSSNAALSALAIADELTGLGVTPLLFEDMSGDGLLGRDRAASTYAWVRKIPDITGEGEGAEGTRVWVLDVASLDMFVGGN